MEGITVTFRRLLGLALIAGLPGIAHAQFTTFIPPVNKTADSVKAAVVAEQKVQQDSIATAQITNMKTWVDSAAGIVPTPTTPLDSVNAGATVSTTTLDSTTAFANGTRAPATASMLPLLLLVGLGFVGAGVAVMFVEPPRERVRVRSRGRRV
jgi:phosphotransferase system  glucose/maltose/N-acetylglucosamine-specific IIC component